MGFGQFDAEAVEGTREVALSANLASIFPKLLTNPLTILAQLCYNNMDFLLTAHAFAKTVHQLREKS